MKKCIKCDEEKPLEEFHFKNKNKGTRISSCKSCISLSHKARYATQERKNAIRENSRKRRRELIDKVWAYKQGKKCADCPQTDPRTFEFDHLPEFSKTKEISGMVNDGCSWEKILLEINKCEIVCASCHRIRTHVRGGWIRNITI